MSSQTITMTSDLYDYMLGTVREPAILTELRQVTQNGVPRPLMQVSPEQGQLMALLIKLLDARKTLDIGVFTGYSALVVAQALPDDGKVVACDIDPEMTQIAQHYWEKAQVAHKINLHIAPASDTLQTLIDKGESNSFDFTFIDADKQSYADYYEKCLQLTRPGGLIALDNMFLRGKVADPDNISETQVLIRTLQQKITEDPRVDPSLIPIGDGLLLARKR